MKVGSNVVTDILNGITPEMALRNKYTSLGSGGIIVKYDKIKDQFSVTSIDVDPYSGSSSNKEYTRYYKLSK